MKCAVTILFAVATLFANVHAQGVDPQASRVLHAALDRCAASRTFSVDFEFKANIDALGVLETTNSEYTLAADRDRTMAALQQTGGAVGASVVMTPQRVQLRVDNLKVHTEASAPADIPSLIAKKDWKEAMDLALMSLGGRALPDALLTADPAGYLLEGVTSGAVIDDTPFLGQPAWRLRFEQPGLSWDVWISAEEKPVLLGYRPSLERYLANASQAMLRQGKIDRETAANSSASMSMSFVFTDWKFDHATESETFGFLIPADSRRVKSLTEGRQYTKETE